MIIAYHIILTGYGHWLPNDPRGSASLAIHASKLAELAEIHFGQKNPQPSLEELKEFHKTAEPLLAFKVLWFDPRQRQALANGLAAAIKKHRLTCYACAILHSHIHILMRRHRLKGEEILAILRAVAREHLVGPMLAPSGHPIFSADRCVIHKSDPGAVRACIDYINENFPKHRLPLQKYPFITAYDGWPCHKKLRPAA